MVMRFRRNPRHPVMRPVIQSQKMIINIAPAARAAGAKIDQVISTGIDSVAAGQTTVFDSNVPTGAVIKYVEITLCVTNLVAVSLFMHIAIQKIHTGQTSLAPNVVGGTPQRNQVFHQALFSVGKEQNSTHVYRFKVPKKFQRVRDGDKWLFTSQGDQVHTTCHQIIYKYYR